MALKRKRTLFAAPIVGGLLLSGLSVSLSAAGAAARQQTPAAVPAIEVKVRVIEADVDADGKVVEQVLMSPSIQTTSDAEGKVTMQSDLEKSEVAVKPHLAADGRIQATITFTLEEKSATKPLTTRTTKLQTTRSLKSDGFLRMKGISDCEDKRVQEALIHDKPTPAIGKPYQIIYVEGSARVVPPPVAAATP